MLARMEIRLQPEEKLTYQMSSLFHGALMECLPTDYADQLHSSGLHPYTQHLEYRGDGWYWVVTCLNREAARVMIHETVEKLDGITIKRQNLSVPFAGKNYEEVSLESFADAFYRGTGDRYIQVQFVTPTSFKQRGKYLIYPDIRCIYQSLMMKYDAVNEREGMFDEETLEQLCSQTELIRYDLRSTGFSMEGVRIPSFIGKITLRLDGTRTMANFANLLFAFGQYSGVGMKTSLGMGCIRLLEGKERGRGSDRETDKNCYRQPAS